ncbi:MAG: PDZ domain-containing protein [Hyphomonadaceae bacterium]
MQTRTVLQAALLAALMAAPAAAKPASEQQQAAAEREAYLADKPPTLRVLFAHVIDDGETSAVLNEVRSALAAFEMGETRVAAGAFDDARGAIESVFSDTPDAKKARSVWSKESSKRFLGEGYERAMVYYYRGLLFFEAGDFENAAAAFKGGQLQDALTENVENSQDFASLAYLRGWAGKCGGMASVAEESFAEAQRLKPALAPPTADDNTLFIIETGGAPVKVGEGKYQETLTYEENAAPLYGVFSVNGAQIAAVEAEDLFWQATSRGHRQMDTLLSNKAKTKAGTAAAGQAMATVGAAMAQQSYFSGNNNMAGAGGALMLGGLLASAMAAKMTPAADLRRWDNLPQKLYFHAAKLEGAAPPALRIVDIREAVGGIGVQLREDGGALVINGVTAGGPAANAGLQAGDVIVALDGESAAGLPMQTFVGKARGPIGSTVAISVLRNGAALAPVELRRDNLASMMHVTRTLGAPGCRIVWSRTLTALAVNETAPGVTVGKKGKK